MQLRGQCALVTGGSAGLGAVIARKLALRGVHLAINYAHAKDRATEFAEQLAKEFKIKTVVLQGDVSDEQTCSRLVEETAARLGQINMLVSNAGWTKFAPWDDLFALASEDWDKTWTMNVKSHLWLFRAAKPYFMQNEDGGSFVISASVAGTRMSGSSLAYSVSKAACIHLMKGLAAHHGPKCRVNAVAPGLLMTEVAPFKQSKHATY